MKNALLIGGGVIIIGGIAYYLYSKKKAASDAAEAQGSSLSPGLPAPQQLTPPSPTAITATAPGSRQMMWKDAEGNIFEMTTDKQRWGFVIKVNGSVQGKTNQAEVLVLGPDGYMVNADSNGSVFVYKNNGWQNVIRDNKTNAAAYLAKLGLKYPTGAFGSLDNAYALT